MSQPRTQLAALFAAVALFAAGQARAQEKAPERPAVERPNEAVRAPERPVDAVRAPERPNEAVRPPGPPATTREAPKTEPRMNARSSHTVDVIAPGEKVDTILGRMRVERPAPPPSRDGVVRPPPGPESGRPGRGPGPGPGPGRSGPPRPGEGGRGPPPSPRTDGSPPQFPQPPR
ncbi:MAG TPA: hypothetical protein VK447_13265 [Myxococcaceae bacterium]|nr:hypothetical protein [Myxococcaceae bacterium]